MRDALDLLGACLADRFSGDIALGKGSKSPGSATDIALGARNGGMRPMRLQTASFLLLIASPRVPRGRRALQVVLGVADTGDPAALRALARAVERHGHEVVWRVWLAAAKSGGPARPWDSPALAGLTADVSTVPTWVVDTAWSAWLADPDPALWSLLRGWNRPASAAAGSRTRNLSRLALGASDLSPDPLMLAGAAARFDHPIGESARERLLTAADPLAVSHFCATAVELPDALEYCLTHGLAPSDETERALFFVRTGQQEQYEALDPDGTLLARGYRAAGTEERTALRTAMAAMGGVDMLRILAGQRSDRHEFATLAQAERDFLVTQLTRRGDWERLWRLVPLMSLPEAVDTVDRFGTWRPPVEADRELFEALRAADAWVVDDGLRAVSVLPSSIEPVAVDFTQSVGTAPHALDFSEDGRHLAFVGHSFAGVLDLRTRTVTLIQRGFSHRLSAVAHLAPDAFVVVEDDPRAVGSAQAQRKLHHVDRRSVRQLGSAAGHVRGPQRIADERFMVVAEQDTTGASASFNVFLGSGDGPPAKTRLLRGKNDFSPRGTAVAPDGRRVAVFGAKDIVVADLASGAVNVLDVPRNGGLFQAQAALSPSALVRVTFFGELNVWHDPLTSASPPATSHVWPHDDLPTGLAWSSALHRFVTVRDGHVELLAVPPAPGLRFPDDLVPQRIQLVGALRWKPCVRLSPQGDMLAVVGKGPTIHLYDLTPRASALTGPMGALSRQDLAEVAGLRRGKGLGHTARQALTLLLACLEHRFRHDIGIGDAVSQAIVSDFDIGLREE
ncbi:hypothetical protein OG828_47510 [Streptomyces sp. NBC_00457]|uniref:hypothetical protein n=1 Tax=Streptomyces sp. NBC_00457 TaxID=2975748 RepID=UPI002E1A75C5